MKETKALPWTKGFKIIGHYCYPTVESSNTFTTHEDARRELMRWHKEAREQGQVFVGRIVAATDRSVTNAA